MSLFSGKAPSARGGQPPDAERPDALAGCQQDLDAAMGTMRESMSRMAGREAKLYELQDKSAVFASASEKFTGQARTLQWRMKWMQYRVYGLVLALIVWVLLAVVFRDNLPIYLAVSSVVFVVLFAVQHFFAKRWIMQVDKTQLLNGRSGGDP